MQDTSFSLILLLYPSLRNLAQPCWLMRAAILNSYSDYLPTELCNERLIFDHNSIMTMALK
jgi:hypothetical protein